jgi:hypothetical protein
MHADGIAIVIHGNIQPRTANRCHGGGRFEFEG